MVIIQSDAFNQSRINTLIAAVITSNLKLAAAPGNVLLAIKNTGLTKDSVANVSQLITVDKSYLTEKIGRITARQLHELDAGVRLALAL